MTEKNPAIWLQAGAHPAEDVRRWVAAITNDAEGVVNGNDLAVTERGTPNMSVDVAGGRCLILGDEATFQGTYFCENRGNTNVVISASDPTNPRIDIIVARVRDASYSGATNAWSLDVVTGTPAGTPVAPATPINAIRLATVSVAAAAATIVNANITSTRSVYNPAYRLVVYTNNGTFTKANFPWAKTVKVTVVGSGGGGGGCAATAAGETSAGGGGGGGGTAINGTLSMSALGTTETVTVGAAGAAGGSNAAGGAGGTSSFGAHASATGGAGGAAGAVSVSTVLAMTAGIGGDPGVGTVGGLLLSGGRGGPGWALTTTRVFVSSGGASSMSSIQNRSVLGAGSDGVAGLEYGGGATGSGNTQSTAARGGLAGARGVVIVELFG